MDEATRGLSTEERADGFRALMRALHNQLARFEADRVKPELAPFNTWRQKFFMDNPDFLYWVADIDANGQYRITGNRGGSAFMSITVYAGKGLTAASEGRITSDELKFDEDGRFEVVLSRKRPADLQTDWLEMPEAGNVVWVRQFYDAVYENAPGSCDIQPVGAVAPPPSGADLPEECVLAMGTDFKNWGFTSTLRCPSYSAWLKDQDFQPSYRRYADILRMLQDDTRRRWVLKAPAHTAELPALLAAAKRIFDVFDIEWTAAAAQSFEAYLKHHPKDKHGKHRYTSAEFGLDPDEIRERLKRYAVWAGLA